ncbi:ATP-dependent DNA helicase DinG [Peribacillus sp. SCS-26]|uniref:ATP-dependent DNA helicase DinG n=1 Tax=Paraperibacillus marinus TaxID=3115295 RepID=UPI0039066F4A
MKQKYIVVDLETTGNSPKKGDSIIQFACVVIEGGKICDEYSTYIKPVSSIPPFIEELTGISNDMVMDAPEFGEVAAKINSLLTDSVFVAHNVLFDLSFLQEELETAGYDGFYGSTIDTVELSKILLPTADSYKLSKLAQLEDLNHERPHRADSDAKVTAMLLLKLMERMETLPKSTLKQLYRLSFSLKSEISELIGECISEKEKKVLEPLGQLEIYKGLALLIRSGEKEPIDTPEISYPYSDEEKIQAMQAAFPHMKKRVGQLNMMNSVHNALNNGSSRIIEAGTGIGKSLAYLLPAVHFALHTKKQVIISTYSLHLQEQLMNKEIPALRKILPLPFSASTIKGKNNYISLAKFERVLRQKDDNYDSSLTKMQILVWLTYTETGDRDELNLTSGGANFWDRLHSGGPMPARLQAPWDTRDFHLRAVAAAGKADLLITNHAYLFNELRMRNSIFQPGAALIIDEAHHFEKAYKSQAGLNVSYQGIRTLMNRLGSYNQKMILYKLERLLKEKNLVSGVPGTAVEGYVQDFLYETESLFVQLAGFMEANSKNTAGPVSTLPFHAGRTSDRRLSNLLMAAERVIDYQKRIRLAVEDRIRLLKEAEDSLGRTHLFYLTEAESLHHDLETLEKSLREFFLRQKADMVYWTDLARSGKNMTITLYSQPVEGAGRFWEEDHSRFSSVILTSATLSVNGSFAYFKEQLGIDEKVQTESYPSPFNYKKAVKIIVPESMPDISMTVQPEFAKAAARHIAAAALGSGGRMMVLFTSRELLRLTYDHLKNTASLDEYTILAQGISGGSKWRLLKNFQGFTKGILLGNVSFWDGVDIQGEKLSCLVIVRLPFSPPDEPAAAAKARVLVEKGLNPFTSLSLPEAVIRFRQGFGRLIRGEQDKGVMIVLDKRLFSSSYGKTFLEAIPDVQVERTQAGMITESVAEWLK